MMMQFTRLIRQGHDGTGSRTPLYDRVGNRLAEYKAHQPARSELYRYDSASRLADPGYAAATSSSNKSFERGTLVSNRSEVNSGASPYEREGWRLDGVNNWAQYGSDTGGLSIGTTIEATAFNEWNLAGATSGYAGYDDNGNADYYNHVAGASPAEYRWDPWNRLREIEDQYHRTVAVYLYDAHNRRVRKIVAHGGVEASPDVRNGTTDYAYQGWRVLWEEFVPEVMPFAPATGPVTFVYGNYLDEVWNAMETDGAEVYSHYYFLTGVNYSVMGVIDAYNTNALAEAYEYDPYGRHRVIEPGTDTTYFTSDDTYAELAAGAINNSIRYTGQRFDAESGLMYYKNRYYDPAAGRFIGRDPLGWDEGPNRYGYVGGNPARYTDPFGLEKRKEWSGDEEKRRELCEALKRSQNLRHFVDLHDPTWNGTYGDRLFNLEYDTIYGDTDIDWMITLLAAYYGRGPSYLRGLDPGDLYIVGKWYWIFLDAYRDPNVSFDPRRFGQPNEIRAIWAARDLLNKRITLEDLFGDLRCEEFEDPCESQADSSSASPDTVTPEIPRKNRHNKRPPVRRGGRSGR
jgi:RHS repeat-associated protein